jgi:hypothetical protein
MLQLLHQIIDFLPGILLPFVGKVEVNHGGLQACMAEELLDTAFGHGQGGGGCLFAVSADGGKDKMGMSMRFPVPSQDIDGCLRQGYIAVFGPFAAVNMEHLP